MNGNNKGSLTEKSVGGKYFMEDMQDRKEKIDTGFEMEVNAPYSLNYLIYIQNMYLNSKNKDKEKLLFPYIDSSMWGILSEGFEKTFLEVWNEAVHKNAQNGFYDDNGIMDFDRALFQNLFENNETGAFGLLESVKSFLAWWDGIYGKIAIEGVFNEDRINKFYSELSMSLNVNKRLKIDLIYDKPFFNGQSESSWYAVLPIEDVFIQSKRPQVIANLLTCCK